MNVSDITSGYVTTGIFGEEETPVFSNFVQLMRYMLFLPSKEVESLNQKLETNLTDKISEVKI